MSRFLGYVRASTTDQQLTLAAQEERLRAWAVCHGHDVSIQVESGVSGGMAPDERPILGAALAELDKKRSDGLVFVKIDRVSRSTRDMIDLVNRAEKGGWALVSVSESIDTGSAMGRFVVRLFASLGELERELIGERTSAALAQLRATGKRFSRHAPWGHSMNNGAVEPNARERAITDSAKFISDTLPASSLAEVLNHKYGPHPRTGKPWTARSVDTLLRSIKRAEKAKVRT